MTATHLPEKLAAIADGGPLHVMHAVLRLDCGGLERIVIDLARTARRRGHRVTVLCLERPGELAAEVVALGASVISLNKPPGRVAALPGRIAAVFNDVSPDVIHTHQIGVLWYCGPAAGGVPVVHSEHGNHAAMAKGVWRKVKTRVLCRMAARGAGAFCCVSQSVADSVGRYYTVPAKKIRVLTNGIDTERYTRRDASAAAVVRTSFGIPAGQPVVGAVGRLSEVKGHDLLLRAVASMTSVRPHVLLVGDGPEQARLEALAHELGLTSRVHFAGYQAEPQRFLAAMDVFAMPSRMEGLPLSLLEAWAGGVPVVATAVGGIPLVVQDNFTGLLTPPLDAAAFGQALARLLGDPAYAARLAAAGLKRVLTDFSLNRMADAYHAQYRGLIQAARQERHD